MMWRQRELNFSGFGDFLYFPKANAMFDSYRIVLTSPPDRESVVAEIWLGEEMWAEVANEKGPLTIEFFPRTNEGTWLLEYEDVMEAIQMAKDKLMGKE
jgi:hypothetical protein